MQIRNMKKYLFITGCPRSGTSALSLLFGSHPQVAMGVERFHHFVIPEFKMQRSLYEQKRFFDFRPGDSHINLEKQPGIKRSYDKLKERYAQCKYFGDKVPYLYDHYKPLINEFNHNDELKLVVIVRNIFDVANSYQVRAENTQMKWQRDYQRAVQDWNRSMRYTLDLLEYFKELTIVEYEDIYDSENIDNVRTMFESVGLEATNEVKEFYKMQLKQTARRDEKRMENYLLETAHKRFICQNAKVHLYKKLVELQAETKV